MRRLELIVGLLAVADGRVAASVLRAVAGLGSASVRNAASVLTAVAGLNAVAGLGAVRLVSSRPLAVHASVWFPAAVAVRVVVVGAVGTHQGHQTKAGQQECHLRNID